MNNYPFASMRDCFDMSAYFVVGPQDCKGRPVTDVVDDALRGGATFIQLRAKNADAKDITEMARDIAQVIKNSGKSDSVAFVIDDRVDVVWQARDKGIKVDGVHIGPDRYGTAGGSRAARRGCHRGPVRRDRKSGEAYQRAAERLHRLHRRRPATCVHHQAGGFRGRQRRFRAHA